MPYRPICGIYAIISPGGSAYVGSSQNIRGRWAEHRYHLKRGTHHSSRLQAAYKKHGSQLRFIVLEECSVDELVAREQFYISQLRARLNCASIVNNVWTNPETREKYRRTYASEEFRLSQGRILDAAREKRLVAVVSDEGHEFACMADAARFFGIKTSGIKHLVQTQHRGKLGIRLKRKNDPWLPERSVFDRKAETRRRNGTLWHSEETRATMRANRKGWRPTDQARQAALAVNERPVRAINLATGDVLSFASQRDAARTLRPGTPSAACNISLACSGKKKSAYGYKWETDYVPLV